MTIPTLRCWVPFVAALLLASTPPSRGAAGARGSESGRDADAAISVQYLEIVTPKVDETCQALEKAHGVTFGAPVPEFGNARMTALKGGGRIGVRAPMRADEEPVVRPYALVDDIDAAIEAVKAAGGEFAMLATDIPGNGKFAIYFLGGIQHGLWQP